MRQTFVRAPLGWRFGCQTSMRGRIMRWCRTRAQADRVRYTQSGSSAALNLGNLMLGRPKTLLAHQYCTVSASLLLAEPSTRSRGDVE